jgi:Tfp pilus assembly protein PilX
MHSAKRNSRGFTLIATLMLMLIMSGVAIGLLMMVNTEGKVGSQDTQNNLAFHSAEGGIEHMTSDLANMFQNIESPTAAEIQALSADAPASTALMSYPVYSLTPATNPNGSLATNWGQIASGTYQGLYAQLLPVNLQVTATTSLFGAGTVGDEVNMSRTVEVALIPVFQFGVFSESDLSFFAGVNLNFAGRTHTNGDLYLDAGTGATTTFQDKVTAWGNVIRTVLANGNTSVATAHLGTVDILTAAQGCSGAQPACRAMAQTEGSVVGGPASLQNPLWLSTISVGDYNSWIIDGNYGNPGGTGAVELSLPFINNALGAALQPQPFEIIRRPPTGEAATSALGASRLYNEAEIRVLLSDDPGELPCGNPSVAPPCGGSGDAQNIRLANFNDALNGVNYQFGVPATPVAGLPALATGGTYNTYFATASTGVPDPTNWVGTVATLPADMQFGPIAPPVGDVTLFDANAPVTLHQNDGYANAPPVIGLSTCNVGTGSCAVPTNYAYPYYSPLAYPLPTNQMSTWNLIDGYLRVEYRDAGGAYHPVTQEWLQLGFARSTTPPTAPGTNPVNPNAILILQKPADRNGNGVADPNGIAANCVNSSGVITCTSGEPPEVTRDSATPGDLLARYGNSTHPNGASPTQYNWYPINFYDAREGEVRDVKQTGANVNSCAPAGVMNAVEIDVGNLKQWLNGTIPGSGNLVDPVFQNGYVLYISDRRGMLKNPNGSAGMAGSPNTKTGDSGLEDSVNSDFQAGNPDGTLEPTLPGKLQSPEDVNNNGILDNWGGGNLGLGLGYIPTATYAAANSVNNLILNPASGTGHPDPYLVAGRIPSCLVTQKNWISGARHVVKLVDGSLGNVPVRLDNGLGGFTVASENPVYIQGDYNSSVADPTWLNPNAADPPHAAAAIIADAVTMLSNNWSDLASLNSPSNDAGRPAATTYYRAAVSGGKNMNFLVNTCCAGWAVGDWGTDGGLHNFLRQLENWGGQTLNYKGSMASLYYSTYSTGTDKNGGNTTYDPPARNYIFDPLFTQPQNLPPGTPLFRDIDNLSYRQSFTPHTGSY